MSSRASAAAAAVLRRANGALPGESAAYRAAALRRPSSVCLHDVRRNSCSFIGTLVAAVQSYHGQRRDTAYTFLEVSNWKSSSSSKWLQVLLHFSGELAAVSVRHLKLHDLVAVSGFLSHYHHVDTDGNPVVRYKVFVQELNHVTRNDRQVQMPTRDDNASNLISCGKESSDEQDNRGMSILREEADATEPKHSVEVSPWDWVKDRHHLWQLLFANPQEWRDCRRTKPHDRYPDFKHRDTGEALWLSSKDPPWVRKQLELYDLKMAVTRRSGDVSPWRSSWRTGDFEFNRQQP